MLVRIRAIASDRRREGVMDVLVDLFVGIGEKWCVG